MKAEKKQMIWPFLAIVAIVAVVGIVMLVMDFKDSSKGGVVGEEGALAGEASLQWLSCIDSDGGINYQLQGAAKVEGTNTLKQEKCLPSGKIEEAYCQDNQVKTLQANCPIGKVCNQGECVAQSQAFICGNGICENNREIESGSHNCSQILSPDYFHICHYHR